MTTTTARLRREGKHFEILVDMEGALKFKKGEGNVVLEIDKIFTDAKKGEVASQDDLKKAFGTTDVQEVAEKIVKTGEIEESQEHRDEEKESKIKKIIDYIVVNAVDSQSGNPHTAERVRGALGQANVNITDKSVEDQIQDVISKISGILPLKIETKKIKITVPAQFTGQVYGVIKPYKESEEWKDDGSLVSVVVVPAGAVMEFYDKLNSVTHGSALTEEISGESGK